MRIGTSGGLRLKTRPESFFSTKSEKPLYQADLQPGDWLVFGRETKGLREEIIEKFSSQTYRVPMRGPIRSLNLATAVAVVLYEGIRQIESGP